MSEINVSYSTYTWVHTNVFAGKLLATYSNDPSSGVLKTYFALNDPLGTKRAEYSADGLLSTFASLPFGDLLQQSGAADPTEQHFTGKERDAESGLDDFGARYYNSSIGRWMSPDWSATAAAVPYAKLEDPQTLNLYASAGNNPISRVDADGHCGSDAAYTVFTSACNNPEDPQTIDPDGFDRIEAEQDEERKNNQSLEAETPAPAQQNNSAPTTTREKIDNALDKVNSIVPNPSIWS